MDIWRAIIRIYRSPTRYNIGIILGTRFWKNIDVNIFKLQYRSKRDKKFRLLTDGV